MDITKINLLFECKTVAAINRILGSSYDILEDVKSIRNVIIKEFCDDNNLKMCNTDEEIIGASFQGTSNSIIDALAANGVVTVQIAGNNGSMDRINSYQDEKAKSVAEPTNSSDSISGEAQMLPKSQPIAFKRIPSTAYTWACPYCDKEMREKDFSFKFIPDSDHMWSHDCAQSAGKLMQHPDIESARAQSVMFNNKFKTT